MQKVTQQWMVAARSTPTSETVRNVITILHLNTSAESALPAYPTAVLYKLLRRNTESCPCGERSLGDLQASLETFGNISNEAVKNSIWRPGGAANKIERHLNQLGNVCSSIRGKRRIFHFIFIPFDVKLSKSLMYFLLESVESQDNRIRFQLWFFFFLFESRILA